MFDKLIKNTWSTSNTLIRQHQNRCKTKIFFFQFYDDLDLLTILNDQVQAIKEHNGDIVCDRQSVFVGVAKR